MKGEELYPQELKPEIEIESAEVLRDKVFMFSEINEEKKEELKKRIILSSGVVRVFVHPFYEEYDHGVYYVDGEASVMKRSEHPSLVGFNEKYKDSQHRKEGIKRIFQEFAHMSKDVTPPIFVFEEELHLAEFKNKINRKGEISNELFIIPTRRGSGIIHGDKLRTLDNFSGLGIKTFLLGGNYYTVDNEGVGRRCVAEVKKELEGIANVEMSALTFPHNRLDTKSL